MHFSYPLFLIAFAVLLIPILVHLFHFRRYKTVMFSSLKFLRAVDTERKNQNRLKHLLVLTSRCLAFASLVLAFAIPGCGEKKQAAGKAAVAIYIDNSFSMEQSNESGILLETAKQKARDIVKSLGEQAEYDVFGNDPSGNANEFSGPTEAIRRIDELKGSSRSISVGMVWKQMQERLGVASNENKNGYIISDFQGSFVRDLPPSMPKGVVKTQCIKLDGPEKGNLSIDSAWLENPFSIAGEKTRVLFKVGNYSKEKVDDLNVRLMVDKNIGGLAKLSVEPYSQGSGVIEFTMPGESTATAWLEIDDPANTFDNKLYFSLQPQGEMTIMLQGNNSYLQQALATNTFFKIQENSTNTNLVQAWYLANCTALSSSQIIEMTDMVRNGARVAVIPAESMSVSALEGLATNFGTPSFREIKKGHFKIDKAGLNHVFFNQVFSRIPKNIEMPTITSYFSTAGSLGNGDAILLLDNGDPFLIRFRFGKGFLYLFTAPFSTSAGNFVQSSLFLPVVVNCAFNYEQTGHIYGLTAANKGYLLKNNSTVGDGDLVLKGDGKEFVPEVQNGAVGQELFIGSYLSQAGFYTLEDKKRKAVSETVALNFPRTESDPRIASSEQLKNLTDKTGATWLPANKAAVITQMDSVNSHWWRLFIWLAALFFAVEVLLLVFWDPVVRRISVAPKPKGI